MNDNPGGARGTAQAGRGQNSPANFGARPAPNNNPRRIENGSAMPQFGAQRAAVQNAAQANAMNNRPTAQQLGANARVVEHEQPHPGLSASEFSASTAKMTPPTNIPNNQLVNTTNNTPINAQTNNTNVPQNKPANTLNNSGAAANQSSAFGAPINRPNMPGAPNNPAMHGAANQSTMPGAANHQPTPGGTNLNPHLSRPMQQAPTAPAMPQKKPKMAQKTKFLIFAGAAVAVVAIVAIIGAVVANLSRNTDPVVMALNKILDNQAPATVEVRGTLDYQSQSQLDLVSHYKIDIDSQIMPGSLINTTNLTLTVGGGSVDDQTVTVDEVYAADGNLYLRADGVVAAMDNIAQDLTMTTNGQISFIGDSDEGTEGDGTAETTDGAEYGEVDEFSSETSSDGDETVISEEVLTDADIWSFIPEDSFIAPVLRIAQSVDGNWVQIPVGDDNSQNAANSGDDTGNSTNNNTQNSSTNNDTTNTDSNANSDTEENTLMNNLEALSLGSIVNANSEDLTQTTCAVQLVSKLRSNTSTVAQLYRNHQFISSTTEGVTLAPINYPVRRLVFDEGAFKGFVDAADQVQIFNDYYGCSGRSAEDLYQIPNQMPAIYVEVSADNDFTRISWTNELNKAQLSVNLGFKYPTAAVNVQTPAEFLTLDDALANQAAALDGVEVNTENQECDPNTGECTEVYSENLLEDGTETGAEVDTSTNTSQYPTGITIDSNG